MASGRFFEACDCLRVASETSQLAKSGRFMPSWPADAALSLVTATQTLAAQPEGPVTAPKHLKTISVAQNEDASRPCKQEKHLPSLADAEQLSACERSGQRLIYYMWVQPFCRSMSFTGRCSQGGPDVSRRGHLALRLGGRGQVRGPDAGLGRQQLHGLAGPLAPRHSTTCGVACVGPRFKESPLLQSWNASAQDALAGTLPGQTSHLHTPRSSMGSLPRSDLPQDGLEAFRRRFSR